MMLPILFDIAVGFAYVSTLIILPKTNEASGNSMILTSLLFIDDLI